MHWQPWWWVGAYLLVGIATVAGRWDGPGDGTLRDTYRTMWFYAGCRLQPSPGESADPGWPEWLALLRWCALRILLWPVWMVSGVRDRIAYRKWLAQGRRFQNIGSTSELHCRACGRVTPVTGCIHGHRRPAWYICSYQCRTCRGLTEVTRVEGQPLDARCACGGELTRDDPILCPGCGSLKLVPGRMGPIT